MGCVLFDPKQVALSGETSDIKTSPQGFFKFVSSSSSSCQRLSSPPPVKGCVCSKFGTKSVVNYVQQCSLLFSSCNV
jgi:hypothetical protein